MYEGIKSLIEACKHVGIMEKMFLESKIKAAEEELAQLEAAQHSVHLTGLTTRQKDEVELIVMRFIILFLGESPRK